MRFLDEISDSKIFLMRRSGCLENDRMTVFERPDVQSLFRPLQGQYVWGIRRNIGSYLSLEFGEPHRRVREPKASASPSERVSRLMARRRVHIIGDWTLGIWDTHWEITTSNATATSFDTDAAQVDEALQELDGQALLEVRDGPTLASTIFQFDLGGSLRTWPASEEEDDQWCLFTFQGPAVSFRNDGVLVVEAGAVRQE